MSFSLSFLARYVYVLVLTVNSLYFRTCGPCLEWPPCLILEDSLVVSSHAVRSRPGTRPYRNHLGGHQMRPFLLCGPVCTQEWGMCRHPSCAVWSLYDANAWTKSPCFTSWGQVRFLPGLQRAGRIYWGCCSSTGTLRAAARSELGLDSYLFRCTQTKMGIYKTKITFPVIEQLCLFHTIFVWLRHSLRSSFSPGPWEPPWSLGIPSTVLRLCWWHLTCPGCVLPLLSTTASGETTQKKRTIRKDICGLEMNNIKASSLKTWWKMCKICTKLWLDTQHVNHHLYIL